MNTGRWWFRVMAGLGPLWGVCVALTACAGAPLAGSTSWREEVLLHDGGRIIVTRSQGTEGVRDEFFLNLKPML
jgi:hypothetical protein